MRMLQYPLALSIVSIQPVPLVPLLLIKIVLNFEYYLQMLIIFLVIDQSQNRDNNEG